MIGSDANTSASFRAESVINAAREAFAGWLETSVEERSALIGALQFETLRARKRIVETICSETGKIPLEALSSDVLATLEILRYLQKNCTRLLRPRFAATPMVFARSKSHVEYRPRGVVLVIAPWNNPFQLGIVPAASALAAGNVVVLKPSERTPATAALIGELCELAGFGGGKLQVVSGGPGVAQALIEEKPDMVFFTGGTRNGRSVLAAAARHFIPVILELGGKDPMIVFADADLRRAARAAVYGAFAHAGQHCVSVKRLYVEDSVYDTFLERVADQTRSVAATQDWGRAMDERAVMEVREQLREALVGGARLLVPDEEGGACAVPTLVSEASNAMRIVREESFAPVLVAIRFRTEIEAVKLANDSPFGLNASVWSRNPERSGRVVSRLETGNVYVNNVLANVGNPYLPFGGVKASGIGRYHGPEGVRSFCTETSVMVSRSTKPAEPNWFPLGDDKREAVEEFIDLRYGRMGWLRRFRGWVRLLRRFRASE